jgi:hypothetical protein
VHDLHEADLQPSKSEYDGPPTLPAFVRIGHRCLFVALPSGRFLCGQTCRLESSAASSVEPANHRLNSSSSTGFPKIDRHYWINRQDGGSLSGLCASQKLKRCQAQAIVGCFFANCAIVDDKCSGQVIVMNHLVLPLLADFITIGGDAHLA